MKSNYAFAFCLSPASVPAFFCPATKAIRPSVDNDFGRSNGKPNARDHIICASTPSARETPNKTV